ncbi:MAG: phosphoglycerate kinase, partial [Patescibacteria group bacterium]
MKLPKLEDLDVDGKRILVRVDLDYKDAEDGNKRQEVLLPTLDYLVDKAERIVLLGHRGRPGGRVDESLSLQTTGNRLEAYLRQKWGDERVGKLNMYVMENLRFNPGEEANDEHYARHLAEEGDIYVNEAFASSHRNHASIVSLPTFLPRAAGFHFISEVENLSRVLKSPKRPLISIISGVKEDKLGYVDDFRKFSDVILIGGRLPDLVQNSVLRQSSGLMLSKVEASKFHGLAKQSQVPSGTWQSGVGKIQNHKSQIKIAKLTA